MRARLVIVIRHETSHQRILQPRDPPDKLGVGSKKCGVGGTRDARFDLLDGGEVVWTGSTGAI
jgi:hypothetical protein